MGMLLGGCAAGGAILLSVATAGAGFLPDQGTFPGYLSRVGATMLLLAPAALLEEVMFRGVAMVVLARSFGRVQAIVALAALFALAHIRNPNTTTLGLVNIGLAGLFLGTAFFTPGGLWTAWGAHLGWNAALAAADAPVSGLPFPIPWINYQPGGPAWLTGGSFGPEGGLLATVTILAGIVVAWRWAEKETA
jgi:membrane protease YdiL (CAAX protease family)